MRHLVGIAAIAVLLSACVAPTANSPQESAGLTPVTWKEATPRATRNYDITECELAGRGLDFSATEEEVQAATASIPPEQVAEFVQRCLTARGYTVTEKPVCTDQQTRDAITAGRLQQLPEFLPPLSSVQCMVVGRGFVV